MTADNGSVEISRTVPEEHTPSPSLPPPIFPAGPPPDLSGLLAGLGLGPKETGPAASVSALTSAIQALTATNNMLLNLLQEERRERAQLQRRIEKLTPDLYR